MGFISYHDNRLPPTHLPSTGAHFFGLLLRETQKKSQNIPELERSRDLILCFQVNAQILVERHLFSSWNIFGKQSLISTYNQSLYGLIAEEQVLCLIRVKSFLL